MVKNIYFIVTEEHFMANYTNLLDHLREFNIPIDISNYSAPLWA